jgi:hypothetical protein
MFWVVTPRELVGRYQRHVHRFENLKSFLKNLIVTQAIRNCLHDWYLGLCPSSQIFNHYFPEIGSVSCIRWQVKIEKSYFLAPLWNCFQAQGRFHIGAQQSSVSRLVLSPDEGIQPVSETQWLEILGRLSECKSLVINLRKLWQMEILLYVIKQHQMKCLQHMEQMSPERLHWQAKRYVHTGERDMGRPRKRCR